MSDLKEPAERRKPFICLGCSLLLISAESSRDRQWMTHHVSVLAGGLGVRNNGSAGASNRGSRIAQPLPTYFRPSTASLNNSKPQLRHTTLFASRGAHPLEWRAVFFHFADNGELEPLARIQLWHELTKGKPSSTCTEGSQTCQNQASQALSH